MLSNLKAEVTKTPLGSLGALCAVVTLISDFGGRGLGELGANSVYADFAIAALKSVATAFLFSYIPAKIYNHKRASSIILYILGAIICSLFCAYYFSYVKSEHFNNMYGGVQDAFLFLGLILGGFSIAVFIDSASINYVDLLKLGGSALIPIFISVLIFGIITMSPFIGF